ncbi:hypothetical protein BGZ75_005057 [Mortierella antarctica]|nr:hypothetical protein BGZ75_005057 [Mortierella antarctica]
MHTPSADAAHLLTQAVLLAWLCHRYHDLATYASEALKQRIHFLAKPDGSNLQDLFIWDPPSSSTSSSSSSTSCRWSSAQIQEYIQRHWCADQSPLNPPHPYSSWDAVPVYCKELDQETLHAIVPIGQQQDHTTVVAVVLAVEAQHAPERGGDKASSCWRYHNIVVIQESQLQASHGWYPFSDWMALKKDSLASNDSLASVEQEEQVNGSETAGDEDTDDDYWGQYNDSEDDDSAAEDTVNAATRVKSPVMKEGEECDGDDKVKDKDKDKDEDEDEDEYWRKYAEQQEQQDRDERKKKMQEPSSAHSLGLTTTTTRDHEDVPSISNCSSTMQASTTIDSAAAGTSSLSSTLPGQIDPTMLTSLMQMLVAQSMDQPSSSSSQSSTSLLPPPQPPSTTQSLPTLDVDHPDSDQDSKSRIIYSLRSIVQDCHRAGFSKDEVFEMLQSVYSTSNLSE